MSYEEIKICVEQVLDTEEERIEAMRLALEENPANVLVPGQTFDPSDPPPPGELALLIGKKWKPGRTLRVRFVDGVAAVQDKVAQRTHTWSKYANIKFDFGTDPDAEIRVSFAHLGSWSYIGTDALMRPLDQPTINFGWLKTTSPDEEYDRVVVHEFGHTLGCIHEHQNPVAGIPWNKQKVYDYYAQHGWEKAKVDFNLFHKFNKNQTQYSEYDPLSIMHYAIPKELTDGVFEVGWNKELSETDKAFIAQAYPKEEVAITELVVGAPVTKASIGQHGEEDLFRFQVSKEESYVVETEGKTDVTMGLYGPDSETALIAQDDDSGKALNARIAATLTPGSYYVRIQHYRPTGTGDYRIKVQAT